MARVIAYVPDLLFGSNVAGALQAAGHEVKLVSAVDGDSLEQADVLVIDLTADATDRIAAVEAAVGSAGREVRTLAFFSHVEDDVRDAARAAGFDLVVPRSRMARAGGDLVAQLLA